VCVFYHTIESRNEWWKKGGGGGEEEEEREAVGTCPTDIPNNCEEEEFFFSFSFLVRLLLCSV